jgi:hypothetical protein
MGLIMEDLQIAYDLFVVSAGFEFLPSYLVVAWLCWIPNLRVAEWMIRQRRAGRLRTTAIQLTGSASRETI